MKHPSIVIAAFVPRLSTATGKPLSLSRHDGLEKVSFRLVKRILSIDTPRRLPNNSQKSGGETGGGLKR
jgi:hypothetical protein